MNIPRFENITEIHDINNTNFIKHLSWECNNWYVKKLETSIMFELNKTRKSTTIFILFLENSQHKLTFIWVLKLLIRHLWKLTILSQHSHIYFITDNLSTEKNVFFELIVIIFFKYIFTNI